jgi:hypothetical protein
MRGDDEPFRGSLDRETLEFDPPETIEAERENLGGDFGELPNARPESEL